MIICLIGVYSVNSSYVDLMSWPSSAFSGSSSAIWVIQPAPLVLALVIGPMMETAMRESLMINQGAIAPMIFRPIAGTIYLAAALGLIIPPALKAIRRKRKPSSLA